MVSISNFPCAPEMMSYNDDDNGDDNSNYFMKTDKN